MMRAYEIGEQTGLGSLRRVERPDPIPGYGEILVKVTAACLNHRDLLIAGGRYFGPKPPETRVPMSAGVGEVHSIGDGVTGFAPSDRVVCGHLVTWLGGDFTMPALFTDLGVSRDGWLADRIVVPAAALVKVPDALSDEQVAPLASAGITAWNALVEVGNVRAGDTVLTLGTGGVSMFALQIAKLHGARVIITSSSDEKLARARELGADVTINYCTDLEWPKRVLEATGGVGARIIIETTGFAGLAQSITAAAPNGRIVLIGALAGQGGVLPNFPAIIGKNLLLKGVTEGSRAMLAGLIRAMEVGRMTPLIDRTFEFDEALAAFEYLESAAHLGKVLIRMTPTRAGEG